MAKELIKKYGIVPKQAMPDSFHSKSSAAMNKFLFQMLTALNQSEIEALDNVHKVLPPWDPLGTLA